MKETELKNKVIRMLRREFPDAWFFKASDKFTAGIPDIIGCYQSRMFGIELKVPPNKVTQLQLYELNRIVFSGGIAGVCYSVDDVKKLLKGGDKQ